MTPADDTDATTPADQITTEDHVVWGGRRNVLARVEWGFVLQSWLLCVAVSLVLALVLGGLTALVTDRALTGERNTELGALTIAASIATFVGFSMVMAWRLTRVSHDRLANSLGVALVHVTAALLLFGAEVILQLAFDAGASSTFDGGWSVRFAVVLALLERSAAASILACLLAAGIVPARGDRPTKTQTDVTPQDRQL